MDLITLRDNEAAFDRYKILPRVLVDVSKVDLGTEMLGSTVCLGLKLLILRV